MTEQTFGFGATGTPNGDPQQDYGHNKEITDYIIEVDDSSSDDVDAPSPFEPGQDFAEHRLVKLAGRGLLSDVWQAFDPNLQASRAVKIMRPGLVQNPELVEQFFVQARAQAKLQHPNVVQVLRVGRWEGTPYFVADWTDGEPLEQRLARDGAVPPVMAWDIVRQTISALAYALDQGLIHRDLHPGNFILEPARKDAVDRRTRVRIKDFGLASILDAPAQGKAVVSPGSRPEYTAPEIVTGMEVDFRSDIYSLGIVLYHMLAGMPPYGGAKRGEILFKQVHDSLPALPPLVRDAIGDIGLQILARMTHKHADQRYSSYEELLEAVEASPVMLERRRQALTPSPDLLTPLPADPAPVVPAAPPAPARVHAPNPPPPKRKLPVLAAVVVLAIVGGIIAFMLKSPGNAAEAEPTALAPVAAAQAEAPPETGEVPAVVPPPLTPDLATALAPPLANLGSLGEVANSPDTAPDSVSVGDAVPSPTPSEWSKLVAATPVHGDNEIVVDNATPGAILLDPSMPGMWRNSSLPGAHAYSSLLTAADGEQKSATFVADVPRRGKYDVFISWVPGPEPERSSKVVCTIHTAQGSFKGAIDQTGSPDAAAFFPVGQYEFASGTQKPIVTLSTEEMPASPNTMLSVDALKLVYAGDEPVDPAVAAQSAAPSNATEEPKLPAGAIVVESGVGGKNRDQYKEVQGKWIDSRMPPIASKSLAYGLSAFEDSPARKCVFSAVGSDTPAIMNYEARFSPGIALPARFHVYVTWPHGGNAANVEYVINHADGTDTRKLSQDGYGPGPGTPNNANVWIHLGAYDFKPGSDSYVAMVVPQGTRPIHTTANGQAYADAVCFSLMPLPDAQEDDRTTLRSVMSPEQAKGQVK